ncbi:PRD domain-containing protein [Proteiniclasticum sp.]|uniref:PRD domain-containing protein n=1 Tax=Proteiniclasticum sp. TaxID=2053595 RepID=UPI0028980663|nr:PRD domain-containing protein [Proteiniclasticum sp.]
MEITQRLDILKMSGQLSEEMYHKVLEIIDQFNENHNIIIHEKNGAMLITHLCIALSRIEKGETVSKIESDIFAEVESNAFFAQSAEILEGIEEVLGFRMPEEERGYMQMHLCVLLENESQLREEGK